MQSPVSIAQLLPGDLDQILPQLLVVVRLRLITVAAPIQFDELAGCAFAVLVFLHQQTHAPPLAYKLQPFFRITAFNASLSRLRSATMCFSRRFSSSSSFSRRASFTSSPPNLLFQVYRVASLTPNSRATSDTFRPASICFSTPMICSSVYRVFSSRS